MNDMGRTVNTVRNTVHEGSGIQAVGWLVILALAPFVIFVNTTGITAIEELIGKGIRIAPSGLATVVNVTSIATAPLILFSGHLAVRMRQKPIYLAGILIFVLGSVGSALANGDTVLLIFRAIQGIGAGPVTALSLGLVVHRLGETRRGVAIGVWGSGVGLGLAAGPLLGAWLAGTGGDGWRLFFWMLAGFAAILFVVTVFGLPDNDKRPSEHLPLDMVGAVLSTLGVVGIVIGVTYGGTWGWTSWPVLVSLCGGVAVMVIFIVTQNYTRFPIIQIAPFRRPAYTLVGIITIINLIVVIGTFVYVGLQLQVNLHTASVEEGIKYLPFSVVTLLLSPLFGRAVDRYGARPLLVILQLFVIGGFLWFVFAVPQSNPSYGLLVPALLALGIATAMGSPATSTSLVGTRPHGEAGEASAVNGTLVQIGAAIGAGIVVAAFSSGYPTQLVASVLALHLTPATTHSVLGALAIQHAPTGVPATVLVKVGQATHVAFAAALKPVLLSLAALSALALICSLWVKFPVSAKSTVVGVTDKSAERNSELS